MSKIIEKLSKELNYPLDVFKVILAEANINENDETAWRSLLSATFAENSTKEFKLKSIGEILNREHEEVLKAAVNCGAKLSKDAGGEFWVVGNGLIRLINALNGVPSESPIKISKPKIKKQEEAKEEEKMPETKIETKETKTETEIKTKEVKKEVKSEEKVKSETKKKASKTSLKSLVSSASTMDTANARKFLVQSKLRKLDEVAYMSDIEVSKIVNKDYVFLIIGNGSEQVNAAIPREELKKLDLAKIVTF